MTPVKPPNAGQGRDFVHDFSAPEADDDPIFSAGQIQVSGVDEILDEIDSVIETNAAAFVQGFVQKGGQ